MEVYIGLLREFGFPVFVATWFMWRMEKRLDRIFELMGSHMQATAVLAKSIEHRQPVPLQLVPPAIPPKEGDAS